MCVLDDPLSWDDVVLDYRYKANCRYSLIYDDIKGSNSVLLLERGVVLYAGFRYSKCSLIIISEVDDCTG